MADRSRRSPDGSIRKRKEYIRAEYDERERRRARNSSMSLSSSSSSSYIDISRTFPHKRIGGLLKTFFTAPSEHRRRLRRRRSGRLASHSNSSSSSVNSDLAYGTGFLRKPKHRHARSRKGKEREKERESDRERGRPGRGPGRRAGSDAEILAVGAGLAALARKQNEMDLRHSKDGRTSEIYMSKETRESRTRGEFGPSRGLAPSKVSYGSDTFDEDGWESASDAESEFSVDSKLAYGSVVNTSVWGPTPRPQQPRRTDSIVDPRLFGPTNSLHGLVTEPVGFHDVEMHYHSDFGQSPGLPLPHSENNSSTTNITLQQVFPIGTNDPSRFEAGRSSVISSQTETYVSRPGPIPIQQPQPVTPVSQSVYEPVYATRTESGSILKKPLPSPSRGKSLAEAALAGVAGAAIGAALSSDRKSERGDKSRAGDDTASRRGGSSKSDSGKEERRREKRGSPDRDDRKERRREKEKEKEREKEREEESRRDKKREKHWDETREEAKAERRERRREERRGERRDEEHRSRSEVSSSTISRTVDPFQFQVDDDAFSTPDIDGVIESPTHRRHESVPTVVTVDREPNFTRNRSSSVKDRPSNTRSDSGRDNYAEREVRDTRTTRSEIHDERRTLEDAKHFYEETEHSTAPIAAAAMGAAVAAVAVEGYRESRSERRRGERRGEYDDYDSGSRTTDARGSARDPVQEEADRAYREIVMARKIASNVIRSRTPSPDTSVVDKYASKTEEEPEVIEIVTPPEMDHHKKKGPYDAPNADCEIDHVLTPKDFESFTSPIRTNADPSYFSRDYRMQKDRPLLNLVQPTPIPSPLPEKQEPRYEPSQSRSKKSKYDREVQSEVAQPTQPKVATYESRSDVVQPRRREDRGRGRSVQSYEPESTQSPTSSTISKAVTWGENETKHFEVESPSHSPIRSRDQVEEPRTSSSSSKSAGWGAIAAGIMGAGIGAVTANGSDTSSKPKSKENGHDDIHPYEYRGVVVEPESQPRSSERQSPPATGPKPVSSQSSHIPGAFEDDLDFTATLAAGLQDTGFDPNIVINDPTYRRRTSPPGSNGPESDAQMYKTPFAETVSDLGVFQVDSPGHEGAPPVQGFIVGEVPDTPRDESAAQGEFDEWPTKLSKKEQKKRDKAAKRHSGDVTPLDGPDIVQEPEEYFEPKLSKKDQKKRDKEAKRQASLAEDPTPSEEPMSSKSVFEEPESYFETPKKSKKKSKKGSSYDDYDDDQRDSRSTVSIPVDAYNDVQNGETSVITSAINDWDTPKKSKKKSKHDNDRFDSPSLSRPTSEVGSELERSSSRKSKDKSKRRSEQYDVDPTEVPLPVTTPSEVSREDYDDRKTRRSNRDSSIFDSADRGDSRSVVSAGASRYDDDDVRKSKKKHRSTRDDDDAKSIASAPAGDEWEDSKKSKKKDKKSSSGFFGLFGSKSEPESKEISKDDWDEPKRKKKSKRSSTIDSGSDIYNGNGHVNGTSSRISLGNGDDGSGHRSDEEQRKKDSFLANPGTLGAGVGFAGAALAIAAQHQHPNAATADREFAEATTSGGSDISLRQRVEDEEYSVSTREKVDPDITERYFRPSIDPLYGDLLPLPPSGPPSPVMEPIDNLPGLPESRPATPEEQRRSTRERSARRSMYETPMKSPSHSAVPLNFIMRNRSIPTSPVLSRASPSASPSASNQDILSAQRSRPRPTSWDSTKEFKPLYLVESNRRPSIVQQAEPEDPLPALPPSTRTSRSSSQLNADDTATEEVSPNQAAEKSGRSAAAHLSINTSIPASDFLNSEESTPRANNLMQSIDGALEPSQTLTHAEPLNLSTHTAFAPKVSDEEIGKEAAIVDTIGALPLASSLGYFASAHASRPTDKTWLEGLPSHQEHPQTPSPVEPMTNDQSLYLQNSSSPSKEIKPDLEFHALPENEKPASDITLDSSSVLGLGIHKDAEMEKLPSVETAREIDNGNKSSFEPSSRSQATIVVGTKDPEDPENNGTEPKEDPEESTVARSKKDKKKDKKKNRLSRSLTQVDASLPQGSEEAAIAIPPVADDFIAFDTKESKETKGNSNLDWEPESEPITEFVLDPGHPSHSSAKADDESEIVKEPEIFVAPSSKKSKKKKGKGPSGWEPESEIALEPESIPDPVETNVETTETNEQPQLEANTEQSVTVASKRRKNKKGKSTFNWEPESEAASQSEPIFAPDILEKDIEVAEAIEEPQPVVETKQTFTSSKKNKKIKGKSNFDWEPEHEVKAQAPLPEIEPALESIEKEVEVKEAVDEFQLDFAPQTTEKESQEAEAISISEAQPASSPNDRDVGTVEASQEAAPEKSTASSKKSKKKKGRSSVEWIPELELAPQSPEDAVVQTEESEQFTTPTSSKKSKKKKGKSTFIWEPELEDAALETGPVNIHAQPSEKEVDLMPLTNETESLRTDKDIETLPTEQEKAILPSGEEAIMSVLMENLEQTQKNEPESEKQPVVEELPMLVEQQPEQSLNEGRTDAEAGGAALPQPDNEKIDVQAESLHDLGQFSSPVSKKGKRKKAKSSLDWMTEPEVIPQSVDTESEGGAAAKEAEQSTASSPEKNKRDETEALLNWEPESEPQLQPSAIINSVLEDTIVSDPVVQDVAAVEESVEPEQFTTSTSKKNKKKLKSKFDWAEESEPQLKSSSQVELQAEPNASESVDNKNERDAESEPQPTIDFELPSQPMDKDADIAQEFEEFTMPTGKKNKKKKGKPTFDWEPEPESQSAFQVEPEIKQPLDATEKDPEMAKTIIEAGDFTTTSSKKSKKKGKKAKAADIEDDLVIETTPVQLQAKEPEHSLVASSKKNKKKSKKTQGWDFDEPIPDETAIEPEQSLESAPLLESDLTKEETLQSDAELLQPSPPSNLTPRGDVSTWSPTAATPWFTAIEEPAGSSGVDYFPAADHIYESPSLQGHKDTDKESALPVDAVLPITAAAAVAVGVHEIYKEDDLEQATAKSVDSPIELTKSGLDVGFSEEQLKLAKQMQEEFSSASKKSKKDKKRRQSSLPPTSEFEEPRARYFDDAKDDHPRSRSLSADSMNVATTAMGDARKSLYSDEQLELARQLKAEQESGGKKGKKDKKKRSGLSRSATYDDFAQEWPEQEVPAVTADSATTPLDTKISEDDPKPDGLAAGYQEDQLSLARQLQAEFGSVSSKKSKKDKKRRSNSQTPNEDQEPASDYFEVTHPTSTLIDDQNIERQATPDQTGNDTPDGLTAGYREEQLELARQLKEEFGSGSKKSKKGKKRASLLRTATEDDFSSENFVTPMEEPQELSFYQEDASQEQAPNPDDEFALPTKKSKKGKKRQTLSEAVSESLPIQDTPKLEQDEHVAIKGPAEISAEEEFPMASKKSKKDKKRQSLLRSATEDDFSSDYPAKESEDFSGTATPVESAPAEEFIPSSNKSKKDKNKKRQILLQAAIEDEFSSQNPAEEAENVIAVPATVETVPEEEYALPAKQSKKSEKDEILIPDAAKADIIPESSSQAFEEPVIGDGAIEPNTPEASHETLAADPKEDTAFPLKKAKKNKKNRQSQVLDLTDDVASDSLAMELRSDEKFDDVPKSMEKGVEVHTANPEDEFVPVPKKKSKNDRKRQSFVPDYDLPTEVPDESKELEQSDAMEQTNEAAIEVPDDNFAPVSKKKLKKDKKRQNLALNDDTPFETVESREIIPAAEPETFATEHHRSVEEPSKSTIANPEDKSAFESKESKKDKKCQSLTPVDEMHSKMIGDSQELTVPFTNLPEPTEEALEATPADPEGEFEFIPKKSKKEKKKKNLSALQDDTPKQSATDLSPAYGPTVETLENSNTLPGEADPDDFEFSGKKPKKGKKKQKTFSWNEDTAEAPVTGVVPANELTQEMVANHETSDLEPAPNAEEFQFTSKELQKGQKNRQSMIISSLTDSTDAVIDKTETAVEEVKALDDDSITVVEQDEEHGYSTKKSKKDKKKRQSREQSSALDSTANVISADEVMQSHPSETDQTMVGMPREFEFSTKKSKKDKKKGQPLFLSDPAETLPTETASTNLLSLKPEPNEGQAAREESTLEILRGAELPAETNITDELVANTEADTSETPFDDPAQKPSKKDKKDGVESFAAEAEETIQYGTTSPALEPLQDIDQYPSSITRKLSKKDKRKRLADAGPVAAQDEPSAEQATISPSWADEMEAQVPNDIEKGLDVAEKSGFDQVLDGVEPSPVEDFFKPTKKSKKGKKNHSRDGSIATAGVLAPPTETETSRDVEHVLTIARESAHTGQDKLAHSSTEPEEEHNNRKELAAAGAALTATALMNAEAKHIDPQVTDTKPIMELKAPDATVNTPTRKLSKKEKRKKNLDKRTPREGDIFDDPVLWEGKDPKSHEEVQVGDDDGGDGFWSPPNREDEEPIYEKPASLTGSSRGPETVHLNIQPDSVRDLSTLAAAVDKDELATIIDCNLPTYVPQGEPTSIEQEGLSTVAADPSFETKSEQWNDNSDDFAEPPSKKDGKKKKKNRVAELYMSLEEQPLGPAETSSEAKKHNRVSEIYQPFEEKSFEAAEPVSQKNFNRSAEVYTPFEGKSYEAEPTNEISLGQIPVLVQDVPVESPSLSTSPVLSLSAEKSRQSGLFGLPILPEESEPRKLDPVPRGSGTPDLNRDSAFVTESPTPYDRGKLHDQEPIRDSGVHLRDYSPAGKPRSITSTDDAIARLSWPSVDEASETVDLFHSQRSKAERATTPSRDLQPPQKLKESKYGDLRSVKPLADKIKLFNDGTIGTGTVAARVAAMQNQSPGQSYANREQQRPSSVQSQRSLSNVNRMRTPDPKITRPDSVSSNRSTASSTHSLRRTDRRFSGDLRSLSQRSKLDLAKEAELAAITATSITAASNVITNNTTPSANEGRVRAKDKDMTDIYDGFGEGRLGSPRSPTRPHSMRRRQSMQVLDLETRLEQLAAENRALAEAKEIAEHTLQTTQHAASSLAIRDAEIDSLKASLDWLHREVNRLTEVNDGLTSANVTISNQHKDRYSQLEAQHSQATRELQEVRTAHSNLATGMDGMVQNEVQNSLAAKDEEIAQLRSELEAAKERIRAMQREILASKADDSEFLTIRDEDYFDTACQQLCQHVQQWVLRFSKFSDMRACRLTREINNDKTIDRLDNAILDGSDVDDYLADRVRRRDVFMSMTMTMVWEFVFTRYLFGMDREQRQKLKSLEKLLLEVGPPAAVHQWRATTLTLLAKRQAFLQQREQDTEAVVNEILNTLFEILPPPSQLEDQIGQQLRRVMKAAVDLSIEMRTQRAEYMMLPPLQPEYDANGDLASKVTFNAALMNERSGDTVSNEDLEAQKAVVRVVLFPLVVKKGDDRGDGDEEIVVCPAQVLVAKPKKIGTGSHDNRSRVSMQSSMPAAEYAEGMENSI